MHHANGTRGGLSAPLVEVVLSLAVVVALVVGLDVAAASQHLLVVLLIVMLLLLAVVVVVVHEALLPPEQILVQAVLVLDLLVVVKLLDGPAEVDPAPYRLPLHPVLALRLGHAQSL